MLRYIIVIVVAMLCLAAPNLASAKPQDGVPPTYYTPAPQWVMDWSCKWEDIALKLRPSYARARACFNLDPPPRVPKHPSSSACFGVWLDYGHRVKVLAKRWGARKGELRERMCNPGGCGVERWRPLVRWNWPSWAVPRVLHIMRYESRGNPSAVNRSSGATGLMQIYPGGAKYKNPDYNLRYAYRAKFLHGGWGHWPSFGW